MQAVVDVIPDTSRLDLLVRVGLSSQDMSSFAIDCIWRDEFECIDSDETETDEDENDPDIVVVFPANCAPDHVNYGPTGAAQRLRRRQLEARMARTPIPYH